MNVHQAEVGHKKFWTFSPMLVLNIEIRTIQSSKIFYWKYLSLLIRSPLQLTDSRHNVLSILQYPKFNLSRFEAHIESSQKGTDIEKGIAKEKIEKCWMRITESSCILELNWALKKI